MEHTEKHFAWKCGILLLLAAAVIVGLAMMSPIPQNPAYNHYADQRMFLGISNALNVLSNLPFTLIGIFALAFLLRSKEKLAPHFKVSCERMFYLVFFGSVFFVGFCSSYYHLDPSNQRLVFDRLPMTIAFMGFFCGIIGERVHLKTAKWLLVPLLIAGIATVWYWHYTESLGHGDLRPYAFIQFFPMIAIPLILVVFQSPYTGTRYLWLSLISYLIAKVFEAYDKAIYVMTDHLVSGHTMKHLLAALSAFLILMYLVKRRIK